jgi:ribosomal protein L40E
MPCTKCGTSNPPSNNFCAHCGSALARVCVKCKAENPSTSNFCGRCGASLGALASASVEHSEHPSIQIAAPSAAEHLGGERKTITALFADIKGSTELMRDLDPEEARAIVDPALKIMIEAVQRYDGYVVQSTGDGIFASGTRMMLWRGAKKLARC